jgi:hypothetical protein
LHEDESGAQPLCQRALELVERPRLGDSEQLE